LDEIRLIVLESDPDVLGISETWINDDIDNSEINIPNYNLYRCDRRDGYGGVALYVNNRVEVNAICITQPDNSKVETVWINISLPKHVLS
jgi:exonuclease III